MKERMSLSDDTWLSTRNKTKVPVKQRPLKRRTSLPKSKSLRPPGIYTLTQTSPPPKELFTATKQSKLNEFFGSKRVVSAVEPDNVGHCNEEQKENLEDGGSSSKLRCAKTSKIEKDNGVKQELFPLRKKKIKDTNELLVDNKGLKRILSGDVEERVSKRLKTGSIGDENDFDKDIVQVTRDEKQRIGLEMYCRAKKTLNIEENKQREKLLKQKGLDGVIFERTTNSEDSSKSGERIENKRMKTELQEKDRDFYAIYENSYSSVNGNLRSLNSVSDRKLIKEIKSDVCDNDTDLRENMNDNSTELIGQPKIDCIEFIANKSYGLDEMRGSNCAGTLKDTSKDGESGNTRGRDKCDLDAGLDLSESSYKNTEDESLNLETQTDHLQRDWMCQEDSQSQLNLSDSLEDSEDSLEFCTQFSLSSA